MVQKEGTGVRAWFGVREGMELVLVVACVWGKIGQLNVPFKSSLVILLHINLQLPHQVKPGGDPWLAKEILVLMPNWPLICGIV